MSESEATLVLEAQHGNRAAFEELVRRTSRLVFARLFLETGDAFVAEDLLQETLILAFRSIGRLNDPNKLRPWLLTIAQNVVTDNARRATRQKRSAPPRVGVHALAGVAAAIDSPDELAERAELRDRVVAVLRSLPEEYRLPLTLRYLAGADYETIETQLGLSNGSLRGLLHRGLRMLRTRLEPEFDNYS